MALTLGVCVCGNAEWTQAEPASTLMEPQANEHAGKVERGELLITALKRENVDVNSAKLAIQSIGKLFDFRLTRAGDKYLFRTGAGQKIVMLRYQRTRHIYEAVWNPETGQFDSRMIEVTPESAPAPVADPVVEPVPAAPMDEDDEIDVERDALAQAGVPIGMPDENDVAAPDDPVQPVDEALLGKVSPDSEFPDRPEAVPFEEIGFPDDVDTDHEPETWNEEDLRNAPDPEPAIQPAPVPEIQHETQDLPGTSIPVVAPIQPVPQQKRLVERESATFSTVSIVMFVIGLVLFLLAWIISVVPAIRLHQRVRKQGIAIEDRIRIGLQEYIAKISVDGHKCLVVFHPKDASFIAPCPPDDEALWKHIEAKTHWNQMAQKPVSDRQLKAIVEAFYADEPDESEILGDVVVEDVPSGEVEPISSGVMPSVSMSDDMMPVEDEEGDKNA